MRKLLNVTCYISKFCVHRAKKELLVVVPVPDKPRAVYRARASGPSLVMGEIGQSRIPVAANKSILIAAAEAQEAMRFARFTLEVAGVCTLWRCFESTWNFPTLIITVNVWTKACRNPCSKGAFSFQHRRQKHARSGWL